MTPELRAYLERLPWGHCPACGRLKQADTCPGNGCRYAAEPFDQLHHLHLHCCGVGEVVCDEVAGWEAPAERGATMSRINWDCEDRFPGDMALQESNRRRALAGKRGQALLRELEQALIALPERRLGEGYLIDGDDVCALGAAVRVSLLADGYPAEEARRRMNLMVLADARGRLRISKPLAEAVICENDEDQGCDTPRDRYERMLAWVRSKLAPAAPGSGSEE